MKRLISLKSLSDNLSELQTGQPIFYATRYSVTEIKLGGATNDYVLDGDDRYNKVRCFTTLEDAELKMLQSNIEGIRGSKGGTPNHKHLPSVMGYARYLKELTDKYAEHLV